MQRHARGEQLCLGGHLDIPGEQHGADRRRRAEHRRAVVDLRAVVRVDVVGRVLRAEHVQGEGGPHEPDPGSHLHDPHARHGRLPPNPVERPPWLVDGADRHRTDRSATQRPGEAAHMVRMQVADQHHRQCRHPEPVQAGVHGPVIRPGVDEHRTSRPAGREHQCVTLPDIARHDGPAGWRPPRAQHPGGDQDQQEADDHCEEQRTDPAGAGEQHDRDDDRGEQPRSGRATRPRDDRPGHRCRPVRHRDEPAHRRAGEPGAPLRGGHGHRRQHRRQHAEHRRRRDRGRRDQVRDHGHQAHTAAQTREQRSRRQARRRGYREHLGDARRYAALPHPSHPPRHDHHKSRSREHRQAEPRVGRECRVGHQQPEHRRGERGHGRPLPADGEGQQHHGAHRGRPQHAGRRAGQHDEPEKCRGAQGGGHPRIGAQQAQEPQHRTGDDREIAARDGGQVAEPGRAEVVAQLHGQVARVAHREPWQQGGRRFGEDRRGAAEAVAQRARGGLPPGSGTDVARPAAHPQHRHREVAPGGRGEQALGGGRLPGEQIGPTVGRGDQQHPAATCPPPTRGLRRPQHRGHQHLRRTGPRADPGGAQFAGVVADDDVQGRRGALPCGGAHGVVAQHHRVRGDDQCRRERTTTGRDEHGAATEEATEQQATRQGGPDDPTDRPGVQAEQHDRPCGAGRGNQPQVRRPGGHGVGSGGHTRTSSRSCPSRRSPMPSTSRSWSTVAKRPLRVRHSTIRCAVTGPTPGRASSCSTVAAFRSSGPAGPLPPPAGRRHRPGVRRRGHPDRHLLAVAHLPREVHPAQVGVGEGTPGGLEHVRHPGPRRDAHQPGPPHLPGDGDHEGLGLDRGARPTARRQRSSSPARAGPSPVPPAAPPARRPPPRPPRRGPPPAPPRAPRADPGRSGRRARTSVATGR